MLNGIGRKVVNTEHYVHVQEGEWTNDELDGYGRSIKFFNDGHTSQYVGYWVEGDQQGWGKHVMQNGVTHEGYFYWNDPYVTPAYFDVNQDGSEYNQVSKKVVASDYIIAPQNPEKEKQLLEEREMTKVFDKHIQSGKAFKDTYGHFNFSLCYEDSLIKLARDANG